MGFPEKVAMMVEEKKQLLRWEMMKLQQNQQMLKLKRYLLEHPKQMVIKDQS